MDPRREPEDKDDMIPILVLVSYSRYYSNKGDGGWLSVTRNIMNRVTTNAAVSSLVLLK